MRNGDFSVEIVPAFGGVAREIDSGHVLARAGQVYSIRLRNHGPLRCVSELRIDGTTVTAGGLVIEPWSSVELERPIDQNETGRFTVVAEGNEGALGPDGGRDNPDLGLIEARFRRELPNESRERPRPLPALPEFDRHRMDEFDLLMSPLPPARPAISAIASPDRFGGRFFAEPKVAAPIERAAGTGLTGHSDQRFVPTTVGRLESEATVIMLRLAIGSEEELASPRPLLDAAPAPARPAARP